MRIGQRELVWQKVVSELPRANLRVVSGFAAAIYVTHFSQISLVTLPTRATTPQTDREGGCCAG